MSLTNQLLQAAPNTKVQICVIADDQEHAVKLPNAVYDGSLQKSLISRANAMATRGPIQTQPTTISLMDQHGKTYTSASTITLRWYFENGLQTFQETFYVVDKLPRADVGGLSAAVGVGAGGGADWDAILRAGLEPGGLGQVGPGNAFPYMYAPPGRDSRRDEEQKKKDEKSMKQYQAEKEAQAARIRERLAAKNLKQGSGGGKG